MKQLSGNQLKELVKLRSKKYQIEQQLFLIEGQHLIEEAYKKNILVSIIYCDDWQPFASDIPTYRTSYQNLKKFTDTITPQKVVGICRYFNVECVEEKRIIALDNLQDPGNVGTIIRTALALDYDKVIFSESTVDKYNQKVIRASQGSLFGITTQKVNIYEKLIEYKKNGYDIIITNLEGQFVAPEKIKTDKFVLVIGNEGQGISDQIIGLSTINTKIEIKNVESLNASVAAALLMYLLR